jgi:hypothetical protein
MPSAVEYWRAAHFLTDNTVEWLRPTPAALAGSEYGHTIRVLLYPVKCDLSGNIYAGLGRTCMFHPQSATELLYSRFAF